MLKQYHLGMKEKESFTAVRNTNMRKNSYHTDLYDIDTKDPSLHLKLV